MSCLCEIRRVLLGLGRGPREFRRSPDARAVARPPLRAKCRGGLPQHRHDAGPLRHTMRPLDKPPLNVAESVALAVDSLLMQAFGPYCATCERRLPDESWIWHKKWAKVLVTPAELSRDSPRPVFAD